MRIFTILCLCLSASILVAQKLDHRQGYIIVQVDQKSALDRIVQNQTSRFRSAIRVEKPLSERLGIYLVEFDHAVVHERNLLTDIRNERNVILAQFDHITAHRAVPNDPLFNDQWQWINTGQNGGTPDVDIDIEDAWDISQGGVTTSGDTIVVAIIDDGLDYFHEDIISNTWINRNEIPDNGIDDDENGYVDDVYGWNADNNSKFVWNDEHGLAVAGMVGAVGNNGKGIAGVNWNVKLMTIVGGPPESSVIVAYAYALEQRALYNETNGEKGAFVVVTNSSFGTDFGQPSEAPLWCSFYDSLGAYGVLNVAATSNANYNVDEGGDLPTACPSEFLISVTSVDRFGQRSRAYGIEHVDFAAPGEQIFTTNQVNGYSHTSGNSFASPIAAGVVALLYSAPYDGIGDLAQTNPVAAARFIRDVIFQGVAPVPALATETKFGGILNAGNSMELLAKLFADCPIPFNLSAEVISDTEVSIDWVTIDTPQVVNARIRPLNGTDWDTLADIEKPLLLDNLSGCTEYEIQLETVCADTATGYGDSFIFKTDGCCEIPATINVVPNANSFHVTWSSVLAAEYFLVQWRLAGETEWSEEVTSLNEVTITHLEQCSFYEFRLQTNCDTSETGFSDIITLRTRNCGNCIDLDYCAASSESSNDEFIDSIQVGPLFNLSGNNGGYVFFEQTSAQYFAGEEYPVYLRPGFSGSAFNEQWRIWIDFNQDGVFENDEMVIDSILAPGNPAIESTITIPADAPDGNTRMRISMAFTETIIPTNQEPCDELRFGEVEDYCIYILRDNNTCPEVDTVLFDAVSFTGALMIWPEADSAIAYTYRYRELGELDFTELATVDTFATLADLEKCTKYEVQIRTVCLQDTTSYNEIYLLETDCDVAVDETPLILSQFNVFPNPTYGEVNIAITPVTTGEHTVYLFNAQGQQLAARKIAAEAGRENSVRLDQLAHYPAGLYFVIIEKDGIRAARRLIKV